MRKDKIDANLFAGVLEQNKGQKVRCYNFSNTAVEYLSRLSQLLRLAVA